MEGRGKARGGILADLRALVEDDPLVGGFDIAMIPRIAAFVAVAFAVPLVYRGLVA